MDDITVTDDLGAYPFGEGQVVPLTYVEGSAALFSGGKPLPAPEVSAGDGLTFSGIGVPAGGSVLLVYEAAVNDYAPLAAGSSITNTASASAAGSAEVSASHTLGVSEAPVLAVIKSVSPSVVKENGVLTYTFVIENSGNAPAEAGELILSDVFTPVLSGLAAALDGTELSSPADYSYDDQTGEFATLEGVISVPAASCSRTESGAVSIIPGKTVLTVSGSV